jgi:protein transport protein SEC24
MFGMPPPLSNQQSMATISPAMGPSGNVVSGPSKIDPNQIPRPVPSSSVLLHETRQANQANPPPVLFIFNFFNSSNYASNFTSF